LGSVIAMVKRSEWPSSINKKRLYDALKINEQDLILLAAPPNITYLTGIREPSGVLLSSPACGDIIITSILDYHRILDQAPRDVEVEAVGRGGEEALAVTGIAKLHRKSLAEVVVDKVNECGIRRVYIDFSWLKYDTARMLREKLQGSSEVADASDSISSLRAVKTDFEITQIVEAAELGQYALKKAIENLEVGVSESAIAGIIYQAILERGGWGPSFPPIVAYDDDTAYPHHTPNQRVLGPNSIVLMDLGAVHEGYCSDLTRTLAYGEPASATKFKQVLEAVIEAQEAAIDSLGPGVPASEPDRIARTILAKHGLEKFFTHGLGHGVGLEIHEKPYLRPGSREILEPGMIVTVEPGVYIPGFFGVRVEDMVLITKKGARLITRISKYLP
jgi:Xaa-Pro dipeptidase